MNEFKEIDLLLSSVCNVFLALIINCPVSFIDLRVLGLHDGRDAHLRLVIEQAAVESFWSIDLALPNGALSISCYIAIATGSSSTLSLLALGRATASLVHF